MQCDKHSVLRAHAVIGERNTRVLSRNGERTASEPILRRELALEVGDTDIVRRRREGRHHAGMCVGTGASTFGNQTFARQEVAYRTGRWPQYARMTRTEPSEKRGGSPIGMLRARGTKQ